MNLNLVCVYSLLQQKTELLRKFKALELNHQFRFALKEMEESKEHFFVTGKAGTGKSTLLQLFRKGTRKKAVVLAPTGIAALNVGGQTIHSFFRFPSRPLRARDIRLQKNRRIYEMMDLLIIDEVSMVRADLFDAMDQFLRLNRNNPEPFGGLQVILFGDIFQLPPVVASQAERQLFQEVYQSPFFFDAKVFEEEFELQLIELTEVFRQKDRAFRQLLDDIRLKRADWDTLEALNERAEADLPTESTAIHLCTTNAIADSINRKQLNALDEVKIDYPAKITGDYKPGKFPTDEILSLKKGTQVMFVRNDYEKHYVNGTLGKVAQLKEESIEVEYKNSKGQLVQEEITPVKWEIFKYTSRGNEIEAKVIGTFTQYPLRLAWAISIHKSQGKTFDHVIIHLGRGAFESGQCYVALSRCTSLEGIVLAQKIRPRDLILDDRLLNFHRQLLM